jgi:hypothetical protein
VPHARPERGPDADPGIGRLLFSARVRLAARWSLDPTGHAPRGRRFQGDERGDSIDERGEWACRRCRGGGRRIDRDGAGRAMGVGQRQAGKWRVRLAGRRGGLPDRLVRSFECRWLREGGGAAIVAERRERSGIRGASQRPEREQNPRKNRCAKHPGHHRSATLWIRPPGSGKPRARQEVRNVGENDASLHWSGSRLAREPSRAARQALDANRLTRCVMGPIEGGHNLSRECSSTGWVCLQDRAHCG